MKRWMIACVVVAAALCSCGNLEEEKLYTPEELGWIIEWNYCGWSEVKNETEGTVTLVTTYPDYNIAAFPAKVTSVIMPGDTVRLNSGAFLPGVSISESLTATIKLGDGTEIACTRGYYESRYDCHYDNPWSERFYENYEQRSDYEVVKMHDKNVRHNLVIRTYHIDNTLVDIWAAAQ